MLGRQQLIDTYIKGTVALYGFVTPRQYLKVFNKYNEPKLLKAELMKYAYKLSSQSYLYYDIYENAIINNLVEREKIAEIFHYQQGKSFYMPTRDEVLSRANPDYYEKTPKVKKLINHLLSNKKVKPLSIDAFMQKLIFMIITDSSMKKKLELIAEYGIEFLTINEAQQTLNLIVDVSNHTRKWSNCGSAPAEMPH